MPDGIDAGQDRIENAVRAVLSSMAGDLTAKEAALLAELEGLRKTVLAAKAEIAAMRVDDITESHIPGATDELDAVVAHTANATNEILDVCETLEKLQGKMKGAEAEALATSVTRIYEACSFQDITGQRISKVVNALKAIEARIEAVTAGFSGSVPREAPPPVAKSGRTEGERLANGPQLPGNSVSQDEIDRLLASFD
jgi:chemotaxis protein CheZ